MIAKDFTNYGYYLTDIDDKLLSNVKTEILKIKSNLKSAESIGNKVDGHITGTYKLKESTSILESIVMPYFIEYDKHYNYLKSNYSCLTDNLNIVMNDAWVNFQNKFEFNPAHTHPGLMSFIIWLDIPYTRQDEIKFSPGTPEKNRSGSFTMYYTNVLGTVQTEDILLDHTFNNKLILFPSVIKHSVSPFYSSDLTRVSVAGNFYFQSNIKNYV